uniref:Uncharacterized protein n=1 Tax=Micrurus lemniscatus lemniscatus TaxID=129467 RepID=A0A2D4J7R4_MICLE
MVQSKNKVCGCRLITFQDWKAKIREREINLSYVYASVSYFIVLNVPGLTEEVNNVLLVYMYTHITKYDRLLKKTYEAQASDISQFLTTIPLPGYGGRGARKLFFF